MLRKRGFAIWMALIMLFSCFPVQVFAAEASVTNDRVTKVSETDATFKAVLNNPTGVAPIEVGIYFGDTKKTMKRMARDREVLNRETLEYWYSANEDMGITLEPGTTYWYRFYAKFETGTVWATAKSMQTEGAVKPQASFGDEKVTNKTETDGTFCGVLYNPTGIQPSEVGCYIGTSSSNMKLLGRDTFVYNQSELDVYYNANAEGMMLEPGTKYYFQFYAIIDGEKVEGKRRSITTKEAEVVEQHIHKWASSTKHAHPHSSIRTCNGCGVSEIVKQSNYMASCTECNPVTEKHFHDWKTKNENAHPHKSVRSCSCGAFEVVKNSNYVSSCTTCNPPKVETVKKVTFKNGTYEISNNASGKFLNAYNSESGWKVVTTNPDGSLEQKFVLNGSNGNYTIKTQGYNGRNLYLNDAMLLTGQTGQFCFVDRGNGAYSISPVNDTSKALTQTNVAIYNYTFVGELFEKFKNHKSDVETFSQIYYVGEKTVSIEYSGKSKSEVITGEIDTCPVVKDGYTYIPARSLVEMIGYEVGWDGITKHISITKIN